MLNKFYLVFTVTFTAYIFLYFFESYVLFRLGRKFNSGEYLDYCLPFYGWILLCRSIKLPVWYVILFFLPFTYPIICVIIFGRIADRLGKNYWVFGLGTAFFVFPIFIMAFDSSGVRTEQLIETSRLTEVGAVTRVISLVGLIGEYAGMEFILPQDGIIIGSDPAVSNIVLVSPTVAAFHTRISPDNSDPQAIIVEDLNSTFGTSYQLVTESSWFPVTNAVKLLLYDKFRVSDACEFEIRLTEHFKLVGRSLNG